MDAARAQDPFVPRGRTAKEISSEIEAAIRNGQLVSGSLLPPVRTVAHGLGISPATVNVAYRQLRERGLVVSEGRRGTRVSLRPPISTRPLLVVPDGIRDLCNGSPDPRLLPPLNWALEVPLEGPHLYGEYSAHAPLLALAGASFQASGVDASAQVVVSGALDAIDRLLASALRPGDHVLVEDPTYAELVDLIRAIGLVPVPVPIDEQGPRADAFAAALPRVGAAVITPRAHNPTGITISDGRAKELRSVLAERPDVLVVENDNSALIAGTVHSPVAPAADRWAIVRSLSKALSPDLRIAVVAGDASTIGLIEGRQLLGPGWVSHILQQIAARLWGDPRSEQLIAQATETYAARRAALIDALADVDISARGESGVNVYIEVPDEGTTAQALMTKGWALRPGEGYRLNDRQPFLRATAATLEPDEAQRLARDLADVLHASRAGAHRRRTMSA